MMEQNAHDRKVLITALQQQRNAMLDPPLAIKWYITLRSIVSQPRAATVM